ncbi:MAG TPA: ATP synthase F1 subunit delta [Pirellulaceae bacterium]|jgi:F-type H+-transporting ATPase subunit delta|nr:ATP synthase F1 subunit delta [Pirellulaceae bacterium]
MADASQSTTIDPRRQQIGAVYAKALLGAAEKAGQTDAVVEELQSLIVDVLDKLPQLQAALSSPRIGHEEKAALIDRAFSGRMSDVLLRFLKVLSQHGRLDCLRAIAAAAQKQLNELQGRVEVWVTTAAPLSNPLRELIVKRLSALLGQEVVLKAQLDAEMVGGLVVRIGDTVFDGSVSSRLVQMRQAAVDKAATRFRQSLERFAVSS